jgi:hypothetical protein
LNVFDNFFLGLNTGHFWGYGFSNYHNPGVYYCILITCLAVVKTMMLFEPAKIKKYLKNRDLMGYRQIYFVHPNWEIC